jgi:hypothetical protein
LNTKRKEIGLQENSEVRNQPTWVEEDMDMFVGVAIIPTVVGTNSSFLKWLCIVSSSIIPKKKNQVQNKQQRSSTLVEL